MPPAAVTVTDREMTAAITGDLDMAATFIVEPALERGLETPDLRRVTLDLSEVTFIDSVGLRVVVGLAGELEARRTELEIVPGPPQVQRVFESAGLAEALPFRP
jgi:anti-anti-sigma factor